MPEPAKIRRYDRQLQRLIISSAFGYVTAWFLSHLLYKLYGYLALQRDVPYTAETAPDIGFWYYGFNDATTWDRVDYPNIVIMPLLACLLTVAVGKALHLYFTHKRSPSLMRFISYWLMLHALAKLISELLVGYATLNMFVFYGLEVRGYTSTAGLIAGPIILLALAVGFGYTLRLSVLKFAPAKTFIEPKYRNGFVYRVAILPWLAGVFVSAALTAPEFYWSFFVYHAIALLMLLPAWFIPSSSKFKAKRQYEGRPSAAMVLLFLAAFFAIRWLVFGTPTL